ncbi:MAG: hypothetical protein CMD80_03215 [Gammaproteobacteria bacterium]|nr:hypothetical protein [Gammaproteobacteria bacterium]|tara:strand:- start:72 stop:509 length:438 start_codon:yes stop_codon:yes gene_type:complete
MTDIFVFIIAIIFLVGSISLALPSKSSKEKSKVRMQAKMLGCKISSTLYGKNTFKNINSIDVSYQIKNKSSLKEGHFIRDKEQFILYSPVQLKYQNGFEQMIFNLNNISQHLDEIIFSERRIIFLWDERKGVSNLEQILERINNF